MRRVVEFILFLALAVAVHMAVFAKSEKAGGASSAGEGGTALVSLQASSASVAQMVAKWEQVPEVVTTPETLSIQATTPDVPSTLPNRQSSTSAVPTLPNMPQVLPMPTENTAYQVVATSPQPPGPQAPQAATPSDTAPVARPNTQTVDTRAQQVQVQAPASTAQRAAGQGGGTAAGTRASESSATLSQNQEHSLLAGWGGELRATIERRKRYPTGARGASGTATVRLVVGRDGRLQGVSVVRSSGNHVLDQAAMAAVRSTRRFPAAPRGLTRPSYVFTLPMQFAR